MSKFQSDRNGNTIHRQLFLYIITFVKHFYLKINFVCFFENPSPPPPPPPPKKTQTDSLMFMNLYFFQCEDQNYFCLSQKPISPTNFFERKKIFASLLFFYKLFVNELKKKCN